MQRRAWVSAGQQGDEVFDGLAEFASARAHREVDGIEVGFAAEATAEIGAGIHIRFQSERALRSCHYRSVLVSHSGKSPDSKNGGASRRGTDALAGCWPRNPCLRKSEWCAVYIIG